MTAPPTAYPALTAEQVAAYNRDGFVIVSGVFTSDECEAVIDHHMKLAQGEITIEGFPPRELDKTNWGRTHNQHLYDPYAMDLMLHPKLRAPLEQIIEDGKPGPVDGIQTMYFWHGSTQRRHQDQYYLPSCMSAWCAFVDVGERNGTIWVQVGSHKHHLITADELKHTHGQDFSIGERYNDAVDEQFEKNKAEHDLIEVPVNAKAGDVVYFHGKLIHRGGPIGEEGAFRHVMANHYVPYNFTDWPYAQWPRFSFDGEKRFTSPQAQPSNA